MIIIDPVSYAISLPRGDTGSFIIREDSGYAFAAEDRAVFTIKDASGAVVLERYYPLDGEDAGAFEVALNNSDTDSLSTGAYSWDVRYVIHPYYDAAGRIVDGDQVETPKRPMQFNILATVGEV